MPRCAFHHHPCQDCGAKTECPGTWEENYDGFPEVICPEYHLLSGGINSDFVCEGCQWKRDDEAKREHAAQLKEEYERSLGPEPRE